MPLWAAWVGGISASLTMIHHVIMLVYIVFKNKELTKDYKSSQSALYITVNLIISCNLLWSVVNAIVAVMELNHHIFGCKFFYGVTLGIYYMYKFGIWYFNILRLEMAFDGNQHLNYNKSSLKVLKIVFAFTAILLSTVATIGTIPYQDENGLCVLEFHLWAYAMIILPDTIMSCLCYWLFHRKMKMVTNMFKNLSVIHVQQTPNDKQNKDEILPEYELLYVLRKYTILCAATIVSTWVTGGIAVIAVDVTMTLGCIDSIINVWCIILYDMRFDATYLKIFGCIAKAEWKQKQHHKRKTSVHTLDGGSGSNDTMTMQRSMATDKSNQIASLESTINPSNIDALDVVLHEHEDPKNNK